MDIFLCFDAHSYDARGYFAARKESLPFEAVKDSGCGGAAFDVKLLDLDFFHEVINHVASVAAELSCEESAWADWSVDGDENGPAFGEGICGVVNPLIDGFAGIFLSFEQLWWHFTKRDIEDFGLLDGFSTIRGGACADKEGCHVLWVLEDNW